MRATPCCPWPSPWCVSHPTNGQGGARAPRGKWKAQRRGEQTSESPLSSPRNTQPAGHGCGAAHHQHRAAACGQREWGEVPDGDVQLRPRPEGGQQPPRVGQLLPLRLQGRLRPPGQRRACLPRPGRHGGRPRPHRQRPLLLLRPCLRLRPRRHGLPGCVCGLPCHPNGRRAEAMRVLQLINLAGLDFKQQEIAELACVCERYCGTQSGGMDQAISIMGQRGLAKARPCDDGRLGLCSPHIPVPSIRWCTSTPSARRT